MHLRSSLAKALAVAYEEYKFAKKKVGRKIDLAALIKSIGSEFGMKKLQIENITL